MRKNKLNISSPFLVENIGKMLSGKSPFAIREAYSTCRTRLMFTQRGEDHPVFAVTSPEPGDGNQHRDFICQSGEKDPADRHGPA